MTGSVSAVGRSYSDRPREPTHLALDNLALGISNCRSFRSLAEQAATFEQMGVRRVFIADDIGCRDAFQGAALIARATKQMELNIAVTNPYLRSPGALAEAILTLQALSGGRVVLGLGSSSDSIIEGQLGIRHGKPRIVMKQTIDNVRSILSEANSGVPIPIMLAAMGPRMLRLAGRLADRVILNTGATPAYVHWARALIAEGVEEAERSNVQVDIAVWVSSYIDMDEAHALDAARSWAARMLSVPYQGELLLEHAGITALSLSELRAIFRAYPERGNIDRALPLISEQVVRALTVIGTARESLTSLEAFLASGAQIIVLGPRSLGAIVTVMASESG